MRKPNQFQCCGNSDIVHCVVSEVKKITVVLTWATTDLISELIGEGDKPTSMKECGLERMRRVAEMGSHIIVSWIRDLRS